MTSTTWPPAKLSAPFLHHPQHELKHFAIDFRRQAIADLCQAGMLRGLVKRFQTQEHLQRQTVVTPPGRASAHSVKDG